MFARTKTLWQRLTGTATADVPTIKKERRFWVRYPSDRQTLIRLDEPDAESTLAKVQDVSRGGIRLLVHRQVDVGAVIQVELPPPDGFPTAVVLATVIHEHPAEGGGWSIGCQFSTELSDEDLEGLGARLERSLGVEQRATERVPARGKVVYRPIAGDEPERSAPIRNISLSGVALMVPEQLDPGTLLSLELRDDTGTTVLTIVGCVVYINARGGKWIAGCNFIRELEDAEFSAIVK